MSGFDTRRSCSKSAAGRRLAGAFVRMLGWGGRDGGHGDGLPHGDHSLRPRRTHPLRWIAKSTNHLPAVLCAKGYAMSAGTVLGRGNLPARFDTGRWGAQGRECRPNYRCALHQRSSSLHEGGSREARDAQGHPGRSCEGRRWASNCAGTSISDIFRAGTPAHTSLRGMFLVTTAPMPTSAHEPIVRDSRTRAPAPR